MGQILLIIALVACTGGDLPTPVVTETPVVANPVPADNPPVAVATIEPLPDLVHHTYAVSDWGPTQARLTKVTNDGKHVTIDVRIDAEPKQLAIVLGASVFDTAGDRHDLQPVLVDKPGAFSFQADVADAAGLVVGGWSGVSECTAGSDGCERFHVELSENQFTIPPDAYFNEEPFTVWFPARAPTVQVQDVGASDQQFADVKKETQRITGEWASTWGLTVEVTDAAPSKDERVSVEVLFKSYLDELPHRLKSDLEKAHPDWNVTSKAWAEAPADVVVAVGKLD